ncbi:MAG: hypothetical protein R2748_07495 [Bryobacterales bacterium]
MRKIAQAGVGVILVTHHLSDIIPEIERVVLLRNGKVWKDGAKAEVLTQGNLEEMFQIPVELVERDGYYHLF